MSKPKPKWNSTRHPELQFGTVSKGAAVLVAIACLMFGIHLYGARGDLETAVGAITGSCQIKGNINRETGERIYHVPGQEYYLITRINVVSGERWFCTEEQARAAGWRKAKT